MTLFGEWLYLDSNWFFKRQCGCEQARKQFNSPIEERLWKLRGKGDCWLCGSERGFLSRCLRTASCQLSKNCTSRICLSDLRRSAPLQHIQDAKEGAI